uniref:Essential protein Yae1 N-terminal domain-containing protein n=1 Tax=Chenopodium quinoa TaxID=63459 RepID=A0A803LR77_CHEQI
MEAGYRDGLSAGKNVAAQEGFNQGFKDSVMIGNKWGIVRGVTREPIEKDEMFPATSNQEAQERTIGNSFKSEAQEETTRILSTTEDVNHVTKVDRNNTQITRSESRAYITSTSQHNQSDNLTVMFEGLEIRFTLLPTLQKSSAVCRNV